MKKVLASLLLGACLLAPCGSVLAETPSPAEPGWGLRPERSAPALLDFARWLSERLHLLTDSEEIEPSALPVPDPGLMPPPDGDSDFVCPERQHCPIG